MGAMLEAVTRHGYAGVTLRELVALAGVSKSTFYEYFESKQDCFLATFERIAAVALERVGASYGEPRGFRDKMRAALAAYMEMACDEPAAASLATVESLALGTAGVAARERTAAEFERVTSRSFDSSGTPISALTARAVVGGINGVVYRRLRGDRPTELPELVEPLVDWALLFRRPWGKLARRAGDAAVRPSRPPKTDGDSGAEPAPSWGEPPSSSRSRRLLSQRERIERGAAQVVVERGYDALSIPTISAAAGVSNQTFYEHFAGKRDAFLAAFETLAAEVRPLATEAFAAEADRPEAVGAGLRLLLARIATSEHLARLAFFELPAAGPEALDRIDRMLDELAAMLEPGELDPQPLRVALEATSSGAWAVVQHEIAAGRQATLPELAPDLARLALAPFDTT